VLFILIRNKEMNKIKLRAKKLLLINDFINYCIYCWFGYCFPLTLAEKMEFQLLDKKKNKLFPFIFTKMKYYIIEKADNICMENVLKINAIYFKSKKTDE